MSMFGWMVKHIENGDKKFGFIANPIKLMVDFPDMFKQSVKEVQTLPQTFIKTPANFKAINKLDTNLIVLFTYSDTNDTRSIVLKNLKNDSLLYKWNVNNPYREHDRILNPILLPHKNLIYSYDGKALRRIDSLGNTLWKRDTLWVHHAINLDSHGDLWVCAFAPVFYASGLYKHNGRSTFYKDNFIAKIAVETGKILYYKSITQIFKDNNLVNYLLKSGNIYDPIHLNDVQPALKTTKYYQQDDLFLSFRQPSIILQFRPATGKVIRVIEGPFSSQHDVDFYGNNAIVFFNNNSYPVKNANYKPNPKDSIRITFADDFYSNIGKYNFEDNSYSFIGDSIFKANHIFSYTESLVHFFNPTTYFVEEQNSGILWVIKNNEVIYKNVYKSQHKGFHHLPNWTRIIDNYE